MVIKLTYHAFNKKRIARITPISDKNLIIYNIFGVGLWIIKGMTRKQVKEIFRNAKA